MVMGIIQLPGVRIKKRLQREYRKPPKMKNASQCISIINVNVIWGKKHSKRYSKKNPEYWNFKKFYALSISYCDKWVYQTLNCHTDPVLLYNFKILLQMYLFTYIHIDQLYYIKTQYTINGEVILSKFDHYYRFLYFIHCRHHCYQSHHIVVYLVQIHVGSW